MVVAIATLANYRGYLLGTQCDRYDRSAVRARGGVPVEHYRAREAFMSATIINLIIQFIAGAVGGNAAGAASKDISLGMLGNTIAGAVGGVGGGQLLSALIPMMAGAGNNVDIGALASQAVGGGVAGAIVAGVVGLIKNKMAS
jgi:hypothetical protein